MSLMLKELLQHTVLSGGSGASLEVVTIDGELKVLKSIRGCRVKARKLAQQYQWLANRQDHKNVARVSNLFHQDDRCSYLLDFYQDHVSLDTFLQNSSGPLARETLQRIMDFVSDEIHRPTSIISSRDLFLLYLKEKLHDKIQECSRLSENFQRLLAHDEIVINGISYMNFTQCYLQLIHSENIIRLNSTYRQCDVHGDLTFENILIDPVSGDFVLIDPNLDNTISTPAIDFAKLCQSGVSRYEDMKYVRGIELEGNEIRFDHSSLIENEVAQILKDLLHSRLDEETLQGLPLYEAIHFSRLLPYKIELSPSTFPLFYSRMIILLNSYLRQMNP